MRDTAPDRRRAPRSEIADTELSVLAFPVPVRLLDISLSGVLLESTHPVELGTRGTLRFNFGGEPFSADVKVRASDDRWHRRRRGAASPSARRLSRSAGRTSASSSDLRISEEYRGSNQSRVHTASSIGPHGLRRKVHVRLIGRSAQIAALQAEIDRVARSDAKVLITGESGVGKEIVVAQHPLAAARARRWRSRRSTAPACPRPCSSRSCSATSRAASPAPIATSPASSSRPTWARSSSTRSAR